MQKEEKYCCDGGCIAIRLNRTTTLKFNNHYGDGTFYAFLQDRNELTEEEIRECRKSYIATIDGGLIEVLDYDCYHSEKEMETFVLFTIENMKVDIYRVGPNFVFIQEERK